MPRRPRIEQVGQYHVINRGVAQMRIFYLKSLLIMNTLRN